MAGENAALIVTGGMTMNREKLEQKLEACMMDFSQNPPLDDGLLLSKTKVLDLIDTATREALEAYIEWSGEDNGVDFQTGKTNVDYFLEESDQSNTKGNK